MTNPFPGIDPYVESQLTWQDFHTRFLTYLGDAIVEALPERYEVDIEGELALVSDLDERSRRRSPDIRVMVDPLRTSPVREGETMAIALDEPVIVPLATSPVEEQAVHRWLEVRRRPDRSLVALIELLSPSNKAEPGFSEYVRKRQDLIEQPIHLIELDFLVAGYRPPLAGPLPRGDYYAFVSRANRRWDCEVYAWSVRRPIPKVPLPLDAPDPDLTLDLAALYATAHENGRYARKARYDRPLALPLAPDDLAWAETRAREAMPPQS